MKERQMTYWFAFIGYVNDLNKLQQFKVSVQKSPPSTSMHFSTLLATVRVALMRSSWRSCFMMAALFIMPATNSSLVFTFSLYTSLFFHPHRQKSNLRVNFKQLYLHSHWKLDTCLYELIYSEWSILPPPKIFTIPPEITCIYRVIQEDGFNFVRLYFLNYTWYVNDLHNIWKRRT